MPPRLVLVCVTLSLHVLALVVHDVEVDAINVVVLLQGEWEGTVATGCTCRP